MRTIYIFGSLLFAMIVTLWTSSTYPMSSKLYYVAFLSYVPYVLTIYMRYRDWKKNRRDK